MKFAKEKETGSTTDHIQLDPRENNRLIEKLQVFSGMPQNKPDGTVEQNHPDLKEDNNKS